MTRKKFRDLAAPLYADPINRLLMDELGRAIDVALALGRLREGVGPAGGNAEGQSSVPGAGDGCIEYHENEYLSALRAYVEDLGGRLEVVAVFPDQRVLLVPALSPVSGATGVDTADGH